MDHHLETRERRKDRLKELISKGLHHGVKVEFILRRDVVHTHLGDDPYIRRIMPGEETRVSRPDEFIGENIGGFCIGHDENEGIMAMAYVWDEEHNKPNIIHGTYHLAADAIRGYKFTVRGSFIEEGELSVQAS